MAKWTLAPDASGCPCGLALAQVSEDDVRALISAGEGQTVEFKETPGQLPKGIRTLVAFANQPQGGTLVFGVRDADSRIVHLQLARNKVEQMAEKIKQNALSMTTAEPLLAEIHAFPTLGVVAVHVPAGMDASGPFMAFGRRYRRVGCSTHEVRMDYRQLARAYQLHLVGPESREPLPYRFCQACGSEHLQRRWAIDYAHDEAYYFIECESCGWSDWSQ